MTPLASSRVSLLCPLPQLLVVQWLASCWLRSSPPLCLPGSRRRYTVRSIGLVFYQRLTPCCFARAMSTTRLSQTCLLRACTTIPHTRCAITLICGYFRWVEKMVILSSPWREESCLSLIGICRPTSWRAPTSRPQTYVSNSSSPWDTKANTWKEILSVRQGYVKVRAFCVCRCACTVSDC
jgi:hypothetical protein